MIKKDELKKLKNAEKIELVTLNKVKGFTPDMIETIVNRLIEAFNNNEEEEFTIKVNNFKMTVYADKLNYINLLDKFHAKIKVAAENKLYTDFKAYLNNTLIKTSDNYITDGSIMLKADYVGAIPEGEILGSANIKINQVITDDNFIKLDNYTINYIKTNNFKNCQIQFVFKEKLKVNTITCNSLLLDFLVYSSYNYPTRRELRNKLEYLYNSNIYGKLFKTKVYNFSILDETMNCIAYSVDCPISIPASIEPQSLQSMP